MQTKANIDEMNFEVPDDGDKNSLCEPLMSRNGRYLNLEERMSERRLHAERHSHSGNWLF